MNRTINIYSPIFRFNTIWVTLCYLSCCCFTFSLLSECNLRAGIVSPDFYFHVSVAWVIFYAPAFLLYLGYSILSAGPKLGHTSYSMSKLSLIFSILVLFSVHLGI